MLTHIVLFWLNENAPPNEREAILADCTELLQKIPVVKHLHIGRPTKSTRPVVDTSYDVGLCVILDDMAAHDVYQNHPLHQEFLAKHRKNWKKILVYDFE
jgi:hypothetical protein